MKGDVAKLTTNEKEILEELFQMRGGYVLNFSDRTFGEFFQNDMALNIFDPKYNYASGSKANRLRGFWQVADDSLVSLSINHLLTYIDTQVAIGRLQSEKFSDALIQRTRSIAARLSGVSPGKTADSAHKSHHSRLDRSAALEDHIRDVLNQAENSVEAMKSLESENRSMQAVGYFHESYPGFRLDKETIVKLAQLGLEIDCDFYFD